MSSKIIIALISVVALCVLGAVIAFAGLMLTCNTVGPISRVESLSKDELARIHAEVEKLPQGYYCSKGYSHSSCVDMPASLDILGATYIRRFENNYAWARMGGCFYNEVGLAINMADPAKGEPASIRLNPGDDTRVRVIWTDR